jgi:NADH-quinone oxidoreductase subunit A
MTAIDQYQVVLIFLLVGVAMVLAPMVLLALLRPRKPLVAKEAPYECGMDPIGSAQVCFDLRFYTDALIFVVFDVEAVFMFPWARVFTSLKSPAGVPLTGFALVEGLIFVGVLFLGLVYVWAKGDIDWVKSLNAQHGVVHVAGVVPTMPDAPAPESEPAPELEPEPEPAAAATMSSHGAGEVASHADAHGHG